MDEKELIAAVAEAALIELDKLEARRIQIGSPQEFQKHLWRGMQNPQPAESNAVPVHPLPVMLPDYPKLKVRYDYGKGNGGAAEWIVVNAGAEEAPYHAGGWYTVFPPSQPASRPITTTLEGEVEKLKAAGVPERAKEDWQRRQQAASKK